MKTGLHNYYFSKLLITYFSKIGIKYAFMSPGSRNTPLALALSDQKDIITYNIIDERSSSFIGLGSYKYNKKPALVITTSGTAVANLYPAIVEAYMSSTPLIIITADRPKKLIGTGANQTINQTNIFNNYIHKFYDGEVYFNNFLNNFQTIENKSKDLSNIIDLVLDSYMYSMGIKKNIKGPVHINIPFEKPLHINDRDKFKIKNLQVFKIPVSINTTSLTQSYPDLSKVIKPIIICTDNRDKNIIKMAEVCNIPIFMECCGSRYNFKSNNIISAYEFLLGNIEFKPDLILRFGKKPISNSLNNLIDKNRDCTYLINNFNTIIDDAKYNIDTNASIFLAYLNENKFLGSKKWLNYLIDKQFLIKNCLDNFFKSPKEHEGYIINKIISNLPNNTDVMIGNSSPIRDLDKFTLENDKSITIHSNRGASGIDGIISTAIGISLDNKSTALIIGDVSFFYDISSLINNLNNNINLKIFIINNNGGHIFDRLDGLKFEKNYKNYWLTPTVANIENAAKLYECNYTRIDKTNFIDIPKIVNKVSEHSKSIDLIEIKVDSETHQIVDKKITENIKNILN